MIGLRVVVLGGRVVVLVVDVVTRVLGRDFFVVVRLVFDRVLGLLVVVFVVEVTVLAVVVTRM